MSAPITLSISLGGSRLEVGVMDELPGGPHYLSDGPIDWRRELSPDSSSAVLCELIAFQAEVTLRKIVRSGREIRVGAAFPGPHFRGAWWSNNLTSDFRNGVPLEDVLTRSVVRACGQCTSRPMVVLDAQADAGAEIYHPNGALRGERQRARSCVLNVATGIAAGFVDNTSKWGVLHTKEEFERATLGRHDNGGGQLGRHLFVSPSGKWSYHYRKWGRLASDVDGTRLTEYLSGPALAARLALELVRRGESMAEGPNELQSLEREATRIFGVGGGNFQRKLQELVSIIRANREPVSAQILAWANRRIIESDASHSVREALLDFRENVACDFGRVLAVFQQQPGWSDFSRRIVLTGGVGQNIFLATDHLFMSRISSFLECGTRLFRSKLFSGGERAAWFFHRGVFG